MIDYTQFGAQLMPGGPDEQAARKPAQTAQQPAGGTNPLAGGVQQPAPTQTAPRAPQTAGPAGTTAAPAPTQSPTFAQLQAAGIPRPAPPAAVSPLLAQNFPGLLNGPVGGGSTFPTADPTLPGSPTGTPTTPGSQSGLGSQIEAILKQLLSSPTAYGTDAMNREYDAGARRIDDDYALRQKSLNEEMARRGLYDSSIAGGNLSDLNIGRRSAQTELMDSLLQKRADYQDNALRSALQLSMGRDTDMNAWLQAWYQLFGGTQ